MHEKVCQHLIYFCTWEYMKELVLSWEITDMRDILQYTMNGAVAMWMKQQSIQKAKSVVVNKFISPLPMLDVI